MRSLLHLLHMMFLLIGITLMILTPSSSALASNPTINWDVQLTMTAPTFQSVGMCKGTTEETSRVGFIGNELGAIWRTQDGVNWDQVVQFPDVSAYWYGIYCFPDAQRVIAVGFSDGDAVLKNGAIITWSFDGGNSWTERQPMPQSGGLTWLQSVFFYNDTHGVILPFTQDSLPLAYYTTNGGKNASDWKPVPLSGLIEVWQSHAISAFGDVTKAFAALQATNDTNLFCTSGNAGMKWDCGQSDHNIVVGSFVSANNGIGLGGVNVFSVYVTHDGGQSWTNISSIPSGISAALVLPTDIVWIPNSDVVIVVGGNQEMGTVAHSLDRGLTWAEGIPQLRSTMFTSLDWAVTSSGIEVWTVGNDGGVSLVLHATVTFD